MYLAILSFLDDAEQILLDNHVEHFVRVTTKENDSYHRCIMVRLYNSPAAPFGAILKESLEIAGCEVWTTCKVGYDAVVKGEEQAYSVINL